MSKLLPGKRSRLAWLLRHGWMLSRRESDRRVPNVRRVIAGRARSGVIHVRNCEPVSRGCTEADKAGILPGALAAPVNYEMNLGTRSGVGAGGAGGMLGVMMGQGSRTNKMMDLRLTNPGDIPGGYAAEHIVPETMRFGPVLPLKGERCGKGLGSGEDPDGTVLPYWGCSATVLAGQPEVIDIKAIGSRVSPEVAAMAGQRRQGKEGAGGETLPPGTLWWPHGDSGATAIPGDSSASGEHVVKASFMPQEIRYTLDKEMDFLEPINFKATSTALNTAVPLEGGAISKSIKGLFGN